MDIQGKTILLLGGSGLVGMAVTRALVPHGPARVILSALTRAEVEPAVEELREEFGDAPEFLGEWGDLFTPESLKDRRRADVLADPEARARLLDDLYGEVTDEVVQRSTFAAMVERHRPDIVVDCVNTATVFAYQNVYASAARLRTEAVDGGVATETVERHLATLYLPQLIRHVQIALESMRRAGTGMYLKIGTAGTGGMGLNIPFTHSEERPSRMLLAKSGVAGAHTLLLYLMARTPDSPAVKEIKPTAAISWKRIGKGVIARGGNPIERFDATGSVPLDSAFQKEAESAYRATGEPLEGVYLDAGENGQFSLGEFETLTALGLMEFITPEEIADNVVREIRGHATGRDVVAALDASTSGPTYRAGVLRDVALARMEALEREHGVEAVAYEMLGPPRLSKLLFEVAILRRLHGDLDSASDLDPEETAEQAARVIEEDTELRVRILSVGLCILLPDGERLLRGPAPKVRPEPGQSPRDSRLAENGWVDLRSSNWAHWRNRVRAVLDEMNASAGASDGSWADHEMPDRSRDLRPGRMAAWVFRYEDAGERLKR